MTPVYRGGVVALEFRCEQAVVKNIEICNANGELIVASWAGTSVSHLTFLTLVAGTQVHENNKAAPPHLWVDSEHPGGLQ